MVIVAAVLRIVQQTSESVAKAYYAAGYYAEGGDERGRWGGLGCERLGLAGEVTREAFERLCGNRHPVTGERLTPRTKDIRRVGYDVSFHAPKSVSVVYEWGHDPDILAAFRRAVGETLAEMEADARARVRAAGGRGERVTGNLVFATFLHRTARPVGGVPDPHLHIHAFVPNATFDPAEGRWKALDIGAVKRDAPFFEALFHAKLAAALRALGHGVVRTRTGWELAGVPDAVLRAFSRRTLLIEETARRLGIDSPVARDGLGARTRERKIRGATPDDLRKEWASRLNADERAALNAVVLRRVGNPPVVGAGDPAAAALDHAVAHCFERSAVVRERELLAAGLRYGGGAVTVAGLQSAYAVHGILVRERDGDILVTTRAVLAEEARVLAFARDGRGTCPALGSPNRSDVRDWLSPEQRGVVAHVLGSCDRVILVRGAAGTGKTALMREAVEAIEAGGRRVVTLAPSAEAGRGVLRAEGFHAADTVARFLIDPELRATARGGVVWVDEAGLLGTRLVARLFDLADDLSARVVLSGDRRQHGPVERGSVLRLLETDAGLIPAEVTAIRRQAGAYREAVRCLSEGRILDGFDRLCELGWVVAVPDGERERAVAADFAAAASRGKSLLVVCPTHSEGRRLTAAVRQELRGRGLLSADERAFVSLVQIPLTAAERGDPVRYTVGDVVEFHRAAPGVPAGTRLVVAAATTARVRAVGPTGERLDLPLQLADRFQVFGPSGCGLAVGDRVRVTRNGRTRDGRHRLNNGAVHTIASFSPCGSIRLDNGWAIGWDFGHLTHGYCLTSHASQGKTVDVVLVCQGAESYPASTPEQFYVSASRGRERVTVYTDDRAALRAAIGRVTPRVTATELVGGHTAAWREWLARRERGYARAAAGPGVVRTPPRSPGPVPGQVGDGRVAS